MEPPTDGWICAKCKQVEFERDSAKVKAEDAEKEKRRLDVPAKPAGMDNLEDRIIAIGTSYHNRGKALTDTALRKELGPTVEEEAIKAALRALVSKGQMANVFRNYYDPRPPTDNEEK